MRSPSSRAGSLTADGHATPANWQTAGFGIYVHWPFCAAKCPYCDFNSHLSAQIDHAEWAGAYETALDLWAEETSGRVVGSVFFGGGTPSLMAPETVGRVLERIGKHWRLANDVEITLEANPTSVERDRLTSFLAVGINRVSLGVQALNDADLRRLGRLHTAEEAMNALDMARTLFDRVSFDLIYARQDQTETHWEAELSTALSLGMDHLSLYQLTIEPGTPFFARQRAGGLAGLPAEERAARLYEITQALCTAAGLPSYEVSNHAWRGAESRHNLIYWRGGDWLGIGPGAHGRIQSSGVRSGTAALQAPDGWLRAINSGQSSLEETLKISQLEQAEEYLMMSLRLTEGTDVARLAALGYDLPQASVDKLKQDGLLTKQGTRVAATPRGRLLLNAVLVELLSG